MTEQVIHESLAAVSVWREQGLDVSVSVNLTARQVANLDLPRQIDAALSAFGLPGSALVVEVTESCLIANPVRTREVLNRLREAGVGLSIDDFGTGYSSFTQLRDLPVSEIKIDKSFVTAVTGSSAKQRSSNRPSIWGTTSACTWSPKASRRTRLPGRAHRHGV